MRTLKVSFLALFALAFISLSSCKKDDTLSSSNSNEDIEDKTEIIDDSNPDEPESIEPVELETRGLKPITISEIDISAGFQDQPGDYKVQQNECSKYIGSYKLSAHDQMAVKIKGTGFGATKNTSTAKCYIKGVELLHDPNSIIIWSDSLITLSLDNLVDEFFKNGTVKTTVTRIDSTGTKSKSMSVKAVGVLDAGSVDWYYGTNGWELAHQRFLAGKGPTPPNSQSVKLDTTYTPTKGDVIHHSSSSNSSIPEPSFQQSIIYEIGTVSPTKGLKVKVTNRNKDCDGKIKKTTVYWKDKKFTEYSAFPNLYYRR